MLKENKDCFAWQCYEMPGLDRKLVEHRYRLNLGIDLLSKLQEELNPM